MVWRIPSSRQIPEETVAFPWLHDHLTITEDTDRWSCGVHWFESSFFDSSRIPTAAAAAAAAGWTRGWSSGEVPCNNLLQTPRRAKPWCRCRRGFSWHRENFVSFPSYFVLDVCQRDRASLGNYPSFPFSIMFTFAAFCYMLSLVLCVSLIFFAIWHVSTSDWHQSGLFFSPPVHLITSRSFTLLGMWYGRACRCDSA